MAARACPTAVAGDQPYRVASVTWGARALPGFRAGPDYREVWLRGEKFILTTNQARVVELLHQNYLRGTPALSQAYVVAELDIQSQRLSQVFRGSSAWASSWSRLTAKACIASISDSPQIHR